MPGRHVAILIEGEKSKLMPESFRKPLQLVSPSTQIPTVLDSCKQSSLQRNTATISARGSSLRENEHRLEERGFGKSWLLVVMVGMLLFIAAIGIGLVAFSRQWAPPSPPEPSELAHQAAQQRQQSSAEKLGIPVYYQNNIGMEFAWCPPGEFLMGTPNTDTGFRPQERQHFVHLSQGFYMSRHEVTVDLFRQIMNRDDVTDAERDLPATNVTWNEAFEFCERLTRLENAEGCRYRLPTEAEWEYACRADSTTTWFFGSTEPHLKRYGWVQTSKGSVLNPAGQLQPNPWGLFDMYGNAWEWCADHYDSYPLDQLTIDPRVVKPNNDRVRRGGSVGRYSIESTSSSRNALKGTVRDRETGFRVVRTVTSPLAPRP